LRVAPTAHVVAYRAREVAFALRRAGCADPRLADPTITELLGRAGLGHPRRTTLVADAAGCAGRTDRVACLADDREAVAFDTHGRGAAPGRSDPCIAGLPADLATVGPGASQRARRTRLKLACVEDGIAEATFGAGLVLLGEAARCADREKIVTDAGSASGDADRLYTDPILTASPIGAGGGDPAGTVGRTDFTHPVRAS